MVKFGKKFFFNNAYIRKNRTVTIISIITVLLLIVTTFFITSQFYKGNNENPDKIIETYKEIDIKLFDNLPYLLTYFKKLENTKITDIKLSYPENFTYTENTTKCTEEEITIINKIKNGEKVDTNINEALSCISYKANVAGKYNIKITVNKKEFNTTLNVIDDEAPKMQTKDLEIYEDESYNVNDFVESCSDNSQKNCKIEFLNTSLVDYSKYKEPGTYTIKLIAKDYSDNKSEAATVNLTIKKIIYYEVKFDTNGGTAIENQTIREGKTISYPSYPSRSGYTFEGWYYNNKEFDMNTPINSNITVKAKWKKIETSNGGSYGGSSSGGNNYKPSGGSSSCIKYKDSYANVSIYFYQLNSGNSNDCMPKSTKEFEDDILKIASNNTEYVRSYYKSIYGETCSTNVRYLPTPVIASGRYAGYLITYTVKSNCSLPQTFTLNCSSKDNCNVW